MSLISFVKSSLFDWKINYDFPHFRIRNLVAIFNKNTFYQFPLYIFSLSQTYYVLLVLFLGVPSSFVYKP